MQHRTYSLSDEAVQVLNSLGREFNVSAWISKKIVEELGPVEFLENKLNLIEQQRSELIENIRLRKKFNIDKETQRTETLKEQVNDKVFRQWWINIIKADIKPNIKCVKYNNYTKHNLTLTEFLKRYEKVQELLKIYDKNVKNED